MSEEEREFPLTLEAENIRLKARVVELEADNQRLAQNIHYPDCWDDLGGYPTLVSALLEITRCNAHEEPLEVD